MISDAKKRADLKYKKNAYKQINFMLHKEKEADVIEYLSSLENKREYFIKLIRSEMKDHK